MLLNTRYIRFFTSFAQFINYDLSSTANGKDDEDAKEQINQTNPYLDASMICGNNKNKVDELQTFKNRLLTDATILNEFTIDTYNFSYALINDFVHRSNNQHRMIKELPLSHVIFRSIETFNQQIGGIDTLMFRYLPALSGKFDSMLNDVLRNHLFEAKKSNHALQIKRVDLSYEKYKPEYDHLSTLERVLGRTYDDLDHEQQGRLTVSHTAIQMIQQYYAIAGVFGIIFGPKVIQNQVVKQLPLSADSDKLDSWINQPVPTYIQFWLWECVNPNDVVQQGRKPMVVQRGPFTYIENKTKTDVFFNPNLTVSFRQPTSYTFVRHMSAADDSLPVLMINTPVITILNIARNLSKPAIYEEIVNLIAEVFDETLFVKRTANEWIWGYEEPLFKAVKKIPIVGSLIPDDHFGYFYGRNATDDGLYTVFTGENDINRLNYINKWNGGSYLTYWNSTQSNQINGTDGSWFPPLSTDKLQSERLYVFSTDVCRSIYLTFDSHSSVLNIPTETFSLPAEVFNNATLNPENAGFGNLDSGVLNVSTCQQGAPIILSQPHFLYAAEHYQAHIDGLAPDADAHRTVLQIEPHTGFVLNAQERIQINVYLEHDPLFDGLKNVPTLIMPAVWINESTVIDQKTADDFKSEVLRIFTIIRWSSIGLVIFGTIALFTVLLFLTKRQRQRKPSLLYAGLNNEPVSNHDEVN
ncbi:unnamed protein product [Rotaria sordida]|uniref:Uncharacterized protein n=1 Tax=Rotaria sordida TaxID=392033 RepID=A0A819FCM4_9BILA|nr:unnamed protein product [Rotaria sordida]